MSTAGVSVTSAGAGAPGKALQRSVNSVCPWIAPDEYPEEEKVAGETTRPLDTDIPLPVTEQDWAFVTFQYSFVELPFFTRAGCTVRCSANVIPPGVWQSPLRQP